MPPRILSWLFRSHLQFRRSRCAPTECANSRSAHWHRGHPARGLRLAIALVAGLLAAGMFSGEACLAAEPDPAGITLFENEIRPLLQQSCLKCHGEKKQESGLRLDSREGLMQGGDNGPAVILAEPAKSLLLEMVAHTGEIKMPPNTKLADHQIAALTKWVELGAPWPGNSSPKVKIRGGDISPEERTFWSFQPIRKADVPSVQDQTWPITDIDRFIQAKYEQRGIKPVATADKRTLLRRTTFDLIGLPPTPEEMTEFLADNSPEAFAKVIDRLLASPLYGERWGRHWLDVVRYADTAGETADYPVPEAYLYRDYVINAFNKDKPYDQFIREQIAGDLLAANAPPEQYAEMVTATGFIATSRRFGFDPENYQHLTIQDTIDTLGQAVLGLSVGCARCHHHKFDPLTTSDYYALYGIFDSTRYAFPGSEEKKRPREFVPMVPPAEAAQKQQAFDAEVKSIDEQLKELDALKEKKEPEPEGKRATLQNRRNELVQQGAYPIAYGAVEGTPHDAAIQKRGEPLTPGDKVPRRFLEILGGDPLPAENRESGRRELAQWLTRPENPLTARVIVNRIWQHHFGDGLVATENDFGQRGQRPTHPELLDFLAARFMEQGWSIKTLHRQILQSRVYQLASTDDLADRQADPHNETLWRFQRQRLDAEAIRDSMLFLSGKLTPGSSGRHPFPPVATWGWTQHAPFNSVYDSTRRSVYLMTPRLRRHPYLALFDGADTNASTAKRNTTTVPTQALFLMNSEFVHQQSQGLAERVFTSRSDDVQRFELAYQLILSRSPTPEEASTGKELVDNYWRLLPGDMPYHERAVQTWAGVVRTLLCRNEFLFVD